MNGDYALQQSIVHKIKSNLLILVLGLAWISPFSCQGEGKINYVNPFIGTAPTPKVSNWEGHGRTYPGAVAPFGYIQLTPETRISAGKGYDFRDREVFFFSCMEHMSGYPHGSSGQCIVQAVENAGSFQLKRDGRPFLHENEIAQPGYYKLVFEDNGTTVETTATTRSGMFRFLYKENVNPRIFIGDVGTIELVKGRVVKGSKRNVLIEFNTSWSTIENRDDGIILTFEEPIDKRILLKLSSSSVSNKNSRENLDNEMPGWNFDSLKNSTQSNWEKHLSVIEVNDDSFDNKNKFYSALYHSMLIPWIVSDVNNEYRGGDHKIHIAKGMNHYGAFSPWDTFRSLHPLFCIIFPERQNDMVVSMLEIYKQKGQLPVEPMTGYHSIPIIVDSYFKDIDNYDKSLAYEAMKKYLVNDPFFYEDMSSYIENGYVPASFPESVTRTVEYAYNDWTLSQFAKNAMNEQEDYVKLFKRGFNFRNLFDPLQMFLVPHGEQGFINSQGNFGFKEGDKWNYSFFTPHNPREMINLLGGDEAFTILLDSAMGTGKILFDNEPNFHIPYLFNYSKSPSKTQEWIADIRETCFNSGESGLPGNDDLGSMSSWFVFNAMGFYPVCPGIPEYNIGTPLFEEVIIHSKDNERFVIKGNRTSGRNKYIQTASLNGVNLDRSWISHSSIIEGGELYFEMGRKPSGWAVQPNSSAYSATKMEVQIAIDSVSVGSESVDPHELFWVKFRLVNRGGAGVKTVRLSANGIEIGSKNVFVEECETKIDSISCRLYSPGITVLSLNGLDERIKMNIKKSDRVRIEYSELSAKPMIHHTEEQQISLLIKNTGGIIAYPPVKTRVNNNLFQNDAIILKPGETRKLRYKINGFQSGMNKVEVDTMSAIFKVYDENISATLVDLNFQNKKEGRVPDRSGFSNHGIIKSVNPSNNRDAFNANTYIEIKRNTTFSAFRNEITLMIWVNASKENRYYSSIFTQGDHNVIQLKDRQMEFFIGGWGRAICIVDLSPSFIANWHHIAGVCDGSSLKIYIDGELKGVTRIDSYAPINGHSNWNLGRNEEFPNKRIFYGEMDGARIFSKALTEKEINKLIESDKTELSLN